MGPETQGIYLINRAAGNTRKRPKRGNIYCQEFRTLVQVLWRGHEVYVVFLEKNRYLQKSIKKGYFGHHFYINLGHYLGQSITHESAQKQHYLGQIKRSTKLLKMAFSASLQLI